MLSEVDRQVLRASTGEDVPGLVWGAAMTAALEHLCGLGYMEMRHGDASIYYCITPAGLAALTANDDG